MIVLDEQLLGRQIDRDIKKWYRGKVRPGTVIKDEVIPALLRQHRGSLFVTINERDFWRRSPADPRYCIACLVLSDARASAVPELLRRLLRAVSSGAGRGSLREPPLPGVDSPSGREDGSVSGGTPYLGVGARTVFTG